MFAKKYRITKRQDFDNIFKKGKSFYCDFFMVKILKNDLDFNRFAVVVSRKVSSKAVERNKIKRVLREVLKKNVEILPKGCDMVVYANKSIQDKSFKELEEKLKNCFKK